MRKAVITLAILLVTFHQLQIGVGMEHQTLLLVRDSFIVMVLVIFLLILQVETENNFFLHLAKSSKLALLSILSYFPLNLLLESGFDGNFKSSINTFLSELPKQVAHLVVNLVSLIPLVAIASLICFFIFLQRKKKEKIKFEDHFIDREL